MKIQSGKLFRKYINGKISIEIINYLPSTDIAYYEFIKEQSDKQLTQVIVNSNVMLIVLEYYFITRSLNIVEIELMEEDDDFKEELNILVEETNKNRAYFLKLIEKLKFLSSEDCIEIFSISLKGVVDKEYVFLTIQSNGIIKVSQNVFDKEIKEIEFLISDLYR